MLALEPANGVWLRCPVGLWHLCCAHYLQVCHPISENKVKQVIIIIIIIITISFIQGIYTYIPETNRVPKEYNVAVILSLLFMVTISLAAVLALMYFYISTSRRMCAVPNMAVFCSFLTS
jgi:hypothetical protein